jgi:hypothetical protein
VCLRFSPLLLLLLLLLMLLLVGALLFEVAVAEPTETDLALASLGLDECFLWVTALEAEEEVADKLGAGDVVVPVAALGVAVPVVIPSGLSLVAIAEVAAAVLAVGPPLVSSVDIEGSLP